MPLNVLRRPKWVQQLQEKPLYAILLLSLIIRLSYLAFDYPLWWDSHIYISMGKFLFSGGEIGIWESFRPLIHPFILGFFWSLRLDPVVVGKVLDLFYSLIVILLSYLLAEKIFNKKVAVFSSLLLGLTPLFIMFTGLILTDPLAMLFGLLGLWFLVRKESFVSYFIGGFFLALSFLTRFPQGIWFGSVFLVLLFWKESFLLKLKKLASLTSGFLLPVIPYLFFNYAQYGSASEPFVAGSWIVTTATWLYEGGILYYFVEFFLSNPLYLFFFAYLYCFFKEKYWTNQQIAMIVCIAVLTILYFLYVPRKEARYLVTILPLLSMMVAFMVLRVYERLQHHSKPILRPTAFVVICSLLLIIPIPAELHFERPPSFQDEIVMAIGEYNITAPILASDPSFVSFLDHPLITLDGIEFAPSIYQQQRGNYGLIFLNDCDLICEPGDETCQVIKEGFLEQISKENKEIFKKTVKGCAYGIYLPK